MVRVHAVDDGVLLVLLIRHECGQRLNVANDVLQFQVAVVEQIEDLAMRCHVCAGMCGVVGDEIMTDLMLLGGRRARQTRSVAMQTQTNNRNR